MVRVFTQAALIITAVSISAQPEQPSQASAAVFTNQFIALKIATTGRTASLSEIATGHECLATAKKAVGDAPGGNSARTLERPFASIKINERWFPVSHFEKTNAFWRAEFGDSKVEVDFVIEAHAHSLSMGVASVRGSNIQELKFADFQVNSPENTGALLGAVWNTNFVVCLLGLTKNVHVQAGGNGTLSASLYPEFGFINQNVALLVAPPDKFFPLVEEAEHEFHLPEPRIGGVWAKSGRDVRTSYLFIDLTEQNADEVIRLARLGGFRYVLIYADTWAKSLGSYAINTRNFPRGEQSLEQVIARCHAAGLKAGLHCLTSLVDKFDPLASPRPDERLLSDAGTTLAVDLDATSASVPAVDSLTNVASSRCFATKLGTDVRVDDEIIQYQTIAGPEGSILSNCVRGFAGTRAAPHKAGAPLRHLGERVGSYLADLRTSLKDQMSERIADVVNRCGADMLYLDGGELNDANGPFWRWVSEHQDDICGRLKRDVLIEGSGVTPWTWHWFARMACDDYAALAPKAYLERHKIGELWKTYRQSFLPAELGWWGFFDARPDHPATMADEVDFYATRMIALDSPVSLETRLADLKKNAQTEELLKRLGAYEELRLSGQVPASVRKRLREGEWRRASGNSHAFAPIHYEQRRIDPEQEARFTNSFSAQELRCRFQVMPKLRSFGDKSNVTLFSSPSPVALAPPPLKAPMPGALCKRIEVGKAQQSGAKGTLDLVKHRAPAIKINVGSTTGSNGPPAILNIQLESSAGILRDHYLTLDFTGERTLVLVESNPERVLDELRPAPTNYRFKAALQSFDYSSISAVNIRWMRYQPGDATAALVAIEALAEVEAPLENPRLIVNGVELGLAATLKSGEYMEISGGGISVFDANNQKVGNLALSARLPMVRATENTIRVKSTSQAELLFTLITEGQPLAW